MNLKPFGETGDCDCYWEQNAQEVATRHQETVGGGGGGGGGGFPYKTPKLPGLIMNKASIINDLSLFLLFITFTDRACRPVSHSTERLVVLSTDGENFEHGATGVG